MKEYNMMNLNLYYQLIIYNNFTKIKLKNLYYQSIIYYNFIEQTNYVKQFLQYKSYQVPCSHMHDPL